MNTGLDPELLTLCDGLIIPASFFLNEAVEKNGVLSSISFDNAAVEIRPKQSSNLDTLVNNTSKLLHEANVRMRLARRHQKIPPKSELSYIPAARLHINSRHIKSVSTFGCTPSYTVNNNFGIFHTVLRGDPLVTRFRSAGFHIHQEMKSNTSQMAVAVLDGLLGLTDVLVNHQRGWMDASRIRRIELGYGRAGEFRVRKIKGVRVLEYRVMSPWPLANPADVLAVSSMVKDVCSTPLSTLIHVLDNYPKRKYITGAINHTDNDMDNTHKLLTDCRNVWDDLGGNDA